MTDRTLNNSRSTSFARVIGDHLYGHGKVSGVGFLDLKIVCNVEYYLWIELD